MSVIGHNSGSVDANQLRLYVERCERLIEERKGIADDIKDVMGEAKSQGYNPKMIRRVIAQRAIDREKREADRMEFETYMSALGLL